RGLGEARLAESERRAPEPRERFEVLAPGFVVHVDALPARDDERSLALVASEVREGVQLIGDIAAAAGGGVHEGVSYRLQSLSVRCSDVLRAASLRCRPDQAARAPRSLRQLHRPQVEGVRLPPDRILDADLR